MSFPYIPISKARKSLIWICTIPTVLVLVVFVLAMLGGRFESIELKVWAWFGSVLLPLWLMTVLSAFQNTNSGLFTTKTVFWVLFSALVLYFLLVFSVVLTYAASVEGILLHFTKSYYFLLPFNAILCVLFALLFFKKESILLPNQRIMETEGKATIELAVRDNNLPMQLTLENLQNGAYLDVFTDLSQYFAAKPHFDTEQDQVIMLQNRYNQLQKDLSMGLVSKENSTLSINEITYASLQIIKKMKA